MTPFTVPPVSASPSATVGSAPADDLTPVELTHIEKRIENWVRFGRPVRERIFDRRRRIFSFRPGSVFAFVRWSANDYGTIRSHIAILHATLPGEPYQTLLCVRPGGDMLLSVEGWPKVEAVLRHIDAIEAADIDACDAAPDHWRHVHNRLATGQEPRTYTPERHRAWLRRQEVGR